MDRLMDYKKYSIVYIEIFSIFCVYLSTFVLSHTFSATVICGLFVCTCDLHFMPQTTNQFTEPVIDRWFAALVV